MCGTQPSHLAPVRLWGWFDTLVFVTLPDDEMIAKWRQHRDDLIAEARASGFIPAAVAWFDQGAPPAYSNDMDVYIAPSDATRAAWSDKFCREHGY